MKVWRVEITEGKIIVFAGQPQEDAMIEEAATPTGNFGASAAD